MSEQRSKRTETENASRVDYLLGLLRDVPQRDPRSAVRKRLVALASQRLKENPENATRLRANGRRGMASLTPVFAAALLVAAGFAMAFVVHSRQHRPAQIDTATRTSHPGVSPDSKALFAPVAQQLLDKHLNVHRQRPALTEQMSMRRMTLRLPYSNSAIETGTDTTIQVSMSQSELLSLGFPINATAQDRSIVAELTLGDDGLPRAISLPLPLEVMKEKK
jgi:hypothetical protein